MTILKNIPSCITPKLLFALASMGHGDEIVLADANFPAASCAKSTTVGEEIRIDSIGIPELLAAIMALLPLDPVAKSAIFMELMPVHKEAGWKTPIWDTYKGIIEGANGATEYEEVERMAFYERAKKAFVIVSTGETAFYGNLILKKGIIGKAGE